VTAAIRAWPPGTRLLAAAVALLVSIALLGPALAPYDPTQVGDLAGALAGPSLDHPFGTDQVGRDVFSRVLAGARSSLGVAAAVVLIAASFGTAVGMLAGLGNRVVDEVVMRLTDMFFAFPYLILAMAVVASLGPGSTSLIIALAIIWWPSYARQVRGHVLAIRQSSFIDASRIVGNSTSKTAIRHVLPHMWGELGVRVSLDLGNVILIASALGFLGLGARPPSPEWGSLLFEARSYTLSAWWLSFFPGAALTLAILLFSLFGDSLSHRRPRPTRTRRTA
jgi:peptide/nickel transport system permease protein